MPIKKVNGKYKYGNSGKEYATRKQALRQMRAMYANGYKGESKETHKEK